MREIKFRAWSKKEKKFLDYFELTMNGEIFFGADEVNQKDYELMQFTGLLDRHGKPIYEGDILEINGKKAAVSWADGGFYFEETDISFDQYNWADDTYRMKVIGNIYENPELLK